MLKKIPVHEIKLNGKSPLYFAQDFEINTKRFFYVLNMKKNEVRGAHAHKRTTQLIWVTSGVVNIQARLNTGESILSENLEKNSDAILFEPMVWLDIVSIEKGSSFMCLTDMNYSEEDYIRDRDSFFKDCDD
jgi:dTDP-4-dehydrorhamnose 3,5-epimerase-like enzyme